MLCVGHWFILGGPVSRWPGGAPDRAHSKRFRVDPSPLVGLGLELFPGREDALVGFQHAVGFDCPHACLHCRSMHFLDDDGADPGAPQFRLHGNEVEVEDVVLDLLPD